MFSAIFWPVKWYLGWHAFILVQKLSISYTHIIVIGEFVLNDDTFIKHLKLVYAVFKNIFQWIIFCIAGYTKPFNINVHTDSQEGSQNPAETLNRGFCLDFVQQPCGRMAG